jgi:ubiquinone/menaquinone biosynthesis C-methylase UbiE
MTATWDQIRDGWDGIASGYDEFVTPTHMWIGNEALQRAGLRAGMRFLDVAAGSGALSIPAARIGAQVLATDLSSEMLDRLAMRTRSEGLSERVEVRVMDGHELELEDGSFDVVGSQFGVMLFPDMPRGIAEMARVTKQGGRVLVVAFGPPQKVEFFAFFAAALQSAVPGFAVPDHPPPLPFQLRDPERLRAELSGAGLEEIRVETVTEQLEFGSAGQMWTWLVNSNPVAGAILAELDLSEEQIGDVQRALDNMLRERFDEQSVAVLNCQVHIGIGTKARSSG